MIRLQYSQRLPNGRWTRRDWLRFGALTGLGTLAPPTSGRASQPSGRRPRGFGRAKSVILVYANGGQSQIDTFDPKPAAPTDVRGAFQPIGTSVSGVRFCEHLPRVAKIADRLTVVRSMSHDDLDHGSATYLALTGRYHSRLSSNPDPSPNDFPTYGAVLQRAHRTGRFVSEAVHVNGPALVPFNPAPGQYGGLLGHEYDPLLLGDVRQAPPTVKSLTPRKELPLRRLSHRLTLKQRLDEAARQFEGSPSVLDMDHLYRKAYEMLSSTRCRRAFDLSDEPPALRDRYGRHRSGQACLLARRLVEADVPLVTVVWNHSNRGQDRDPTDTDLYGWDTHNDIFDALQNRLLPRFDESFATLVEDLDDRGLLDETLLICMGEFGRAPRVALEPRFKGASPGRKHWSKVYSILFAGAGVSRGAIVGASDRLGGEPTTERFGPWDVAATIYSALGVDYTGEYHDALDRPFPLTIGRPIEQLYLG